MYRKNDAICIGISIQISSFPDSAIVLKKSGYAYRNFGMPSHDLKKLNSENKYFKN